MVTARAVVTRDDAVAAVTSVERASIDGMANATPPDLPTHLARRFKTWRYGVGHSLLALRSPKPEYETNLDVVFHAVRLMLLADHYDTLPLRRATATEDQDAW